MEDDVVDLVNTCYEALLDLKCIFPYWSDVQGNFNYHWKQILDSSIKHKDSENQVVKKYAAALKPLLNYKEGGVDQNTAMELVKTLDANRAAQDNEFEPYVLEEVLNHDAPSIKPPQRKAKPPVAKKKAPVVPKIVLTEETSGGHSYGTRRSKMLSEGDPAADGNPASSSYRMGQHLKRGLSSDYVWEFSDVGDADLKDE